MIRESMQLRPRPSRRGLVRLSLGRRLGMFPARHTCLHRGVIDYYLSPNGGVFGVCRACCRVISHTRNSPRRRSREAVQ